MISPRVGDVTLLKELGKLKENKTCMKSHNACMIPFFDEPSLQKEIQCLRLKWYKFIRNYKKKIYDFFFPL